MLTPALSGPSEKLVRARVVNPVDDLLPYRPVVLHLGVFPFVPDAVGVRGVFDHGDGPRALCVNWLGGNLPPPPGVVLWENDETVVLIIAV